MACEEAGVILNLVKFLCPKFGLLTDLGFKDAWYMHLQWTSQPKAQDSVLTPGSFSFPGAIKSGGDPGAWTGDMAVARACGRPL